MLVQVRAQDNSGFGFLLNSGVGLTGTLIDDSSALVNGTGIGIGGGSCFSAIPSLSAMASAC